MIHVIGGGLAGSEAAWQAASLGVRVVIHEMRPVRPTAVHKTERLAELVCSNSFRGDKLDNAVGLLKEEMRRLGSLVMRAAVRGSWAWNMRPATMIHPVRNVNMAPQRNHHSAFGARPRVIALLAVPPSSVPKKGGWMKLK